MKIETLKRTKTSTDRECRNDLRKQSRNINPQFHPMQRSREYHRAVVAAKMSRMFAKPLMAGGNMEHRDAITCSAVSRKSLAPLVAGSADGAVKLWDIHSRICVANWEGAHARAVTGVCFDADGQNVYSCSDDGRIHRWSATAGTKENASTPDLSWRINGTFKSIDHHWNEDRFATASDECVQIWTPNRTTPIVSFRDLWGSADTVTAVRYHPTERDLLAHCSADRGIGLHDTRTNQNLRKCILRMRCNDLQWNPMEPMSFAVANEDYNAFTFDMRQLARPMRIYKGHVSAVVRWPLRFLLLRKVLSYSHRSLLDVRDVGSKWA
jgi:DDB1- and CUL4-associated factor 13